VPSGQCAVEVVQQLQHLRQRMAWLVGNLQIYLQQDVIESSFEEMQVGRTWARGWGWLAGWLAGWMAGPC
jgi:hypothetical protein